VAENHYQEVETELLQLFKRERAKGTLITNQYLMAEARKIADKKGIEWFVGSQTWLEVFKRRNSICYRKSTRVSQKVKEKSLKQLKEFHEKVSKLIEEHNYPQEAIWNADETSITFDSPSNFTLDFKVIHFLFFYIV